MVGAPLAGVAEVSVSPPSGDRIVKDFPIAQDSTLEGGIQRFC